MVDADKLGQARFGSYILREKIGEGGFSVVYRGEHGSGGRDIALKVMREELTLDKSKIKDFNREYAILQDLEGVGEVVGEFVHALFHGGIGILDVMGTDAGEGPSGFDIDHAGVGDHFGVDVPVGHHQFANQAESFPQFAAGPAGQFAVQPANAGRIGNDGE